MRYSNYSLFIILCSCVILASCSRSGGISKQLEDVDSIIESHPDSALAMLKEIDMSKLQTQRDMAKHSLLLSMAMDKNKEFVTNFDVLQPAIDYYENNGSPTDRMRTQYYQARIYTNQKNDAMALKHYLRASDEGAESEDIRVKARILYYQGQIYGTFNRWDKVAETELKAASLFKQVEQWDNYGVSMTLVINACSIMGDNISAKEHFDETKEYIPLMSIAHQAGLHARNISIMMETESKETLLQAVDSYQTEFPKEEVCWLTVAHAYYEIGEYGKAYEAIGKCKPYMHKYNNIGYYSILIDILEKQGRYEEAVKAGKSLQAVTDSINYTVSQFETQTIEDKYALKIQSLKSRKEKTSIIAFALSGALILLLIIVWTYSRLKISRMQKIQMEQEKETFRLKYFEAKAEEENLLNLLEHEKEMDAKAKEAVRNRLDLLNRFFMAHITNDTRIDQKTQKEMEALVNNRELFMDSTRRAFAGSHPKFIKYLTDHGLTEWETNYCCLYALGLKGKEVGTYIKLARHYTYSSEIREKLQIDEHETNLGNYIRRIITELG